MTVTSLRGGSSSAGSVLVVVVVVIGEVDDVDEFAGTVVAVVDVGGSVVSASVVGTASDVVETSTVGDGTTIVASTGSSFGSPAMATPAPIANNATTTYANHGCLMTFRGYRRRLSRTGHFVDA
jgi:hypothetical protein